MKAGRKKIDDKKDRVILYLKESFIEKNGGKEQLRNMIYAYLDRL